MDDKDARFVEGIRASIGGYSQYGPGVVEKLLRIIDSIIYVDKKPDTPTGLDGFDMNTMNRFVMRDGPAARYNGYKVVFGQ